jgi:hypothetical protein
LTAVDDGAIKDIGNENNHKDVPIRLPDGRHVFRERFIGKGTAPLAGLPRISARWYRKRCDGDILMQRLNARRNIMQFSDIFVPRWQNSNPEVRKRAVERIKDTRLLAQIAEKDDDPGVRQAAVTRLESIHVEETVT